MSLGLNENNEVVLGLPHDWSKFREYLISQGLGGYVAGAPLTHFREVQSGPLGGSWSDGRELYVNDQDFCYRLKGDKHWHTRLFYVENKQAFESGEYVLEVKNGIASWEPITPRSNYPNFDQCFEYRIVPRPKVKTQHQLFYQAVAKAGQQNELFMDMVKAGDMTYTDLQALIKRRPEVYGKYAGFLDYLKPNEYRFVVLHADTISLIRITGLNKFSSSKAWGLAWEAYLNKACTEPDIVIGEDNPLFARSSVSDEEWAEAMVVEVDPLT